MKLLKIAFAGTHGTGKTTLAEALAERIADMHLYRVMAYVIPTIARNCPFPINGKDSQTTVDAQTWIIMSRIVGELNKENPVFNPFRENTVLIDSRTVVDDYAYLLARFPRDESVKMESVICDYWMKTYDYVFYLPIEFPLEDDGKRDTDPKFQKLVDDIIVEELARRSIPKVRLRGSVKVRINQAMKIIEKDLKKLEQERIEDKKTTLKTLAEMRPEKLNDLDGELLD